MIHTIKRAVIAIVVAVVIYLLSGPIIGYTQYDMYLKAIEFLGQSQIPCKHHLRCE